MPVRFVKTNQIIPACVVPCPLPPINLQPKIIIPFLGNELIAGGNLKLTGGCGDCNVALDLYAKLNPYLLSLGLPLCAMNCVLSLLTAVNDGLDLLGTTVDVFTTIPPDPTQVSDWGKKAKDIIAKDVPDIALKCQCVLNMFLPTGLCQFIKLARDTLLLVSSILKCLATLLGDIFRIGLKANLLSQSPDIRVQASAACLAQIGTNQMNDLNQQMNAVWALILGIGAVFTFIEEAGTLLLKPFGVDYPEDAKFSKITDAIEMFLNKTSAALANGTDIKLLIPNLAEFKALVLEMVGIMEDTASVFTFIIQTGQCP